jgi:hypothetical protein
MKRIYLLLFVFIFSNSFSQNPFGDGSFETSDFRSNGWTLKSYDLKYNDLGPQNFGSDCCNWVWFICTRRCPNYRRLERNNCEAKIELNRLLPSGEFSAKGNYSLCLGGNKSIGRIESLSKNIYISKKNQFVKLWFTVFTEHVTQDLISILINGKPINIITNFGIFSGNISTNIGLKRLNNLNIDYKEWVCAYIDVSQFYGQTVTFEIRNLDCIYNRHHTYSYFDDFNVISKDNMTSLSLERNGCEFLGRFNFNMGDCITPNATPAIKLYPHKNGARLMNVPAYTVPSSKIDYTNKTFSVSTLDLITYWPSITDYDVVASLEYSYAGSNFYKETPFEGAEPNYNNDIQFANGSVMMFYNSIAQFGTLGCNLELMQSAPVLKLSNQICHTGKLLRAELVPYRHGKKITSVVPFNLNFLLSRWPQNISLLMIKNQWPSLDQYDVVFEAEYELMGKKYVYRTDINGFLWGKNNDIFRMCEQKENEFVKNATCTQQITFSYPIPSPCGDFSVIKIGGGSGQALQNVAPDLVLPPRSISNLSNTAYAPQTTLGLAQPVQISNPTSNPFLNEWIKSNSQKPTSMSLSDMLSSVDDISRYQLNQDWEVLKSQVAVSNSNRYLLNNELETPFISEFGGNTVVKTFPKLGPIADPISTSVSYIMPDNKCVFQRNQFLNIVKSYKGKMGFVGYPQTVGSYQFQKIDSSWDCDIDRLVHEITYKCRDCIGFEYDVKMRVQTDCNIVLCDSFVCKPDANQRINPYLSNLKGNIMPTGQFAFNTKRVSLPQNNTRQGNYFAQYEAKYRSTTNGWQSSSHPSWIGMEIPKNISKSGKVLETINPLGIYTTTKYGFDGSFPIMVANDARYHELLSFGFEDQDFRTSGDLLNEKESEFFTITNASDQNPDFYRVHNILEAKIDQTVSHTGSNSYYVAPKNGTQHGFTSRFVSLCGPNVPTNLQAPNFSIVAGKQIQSLPNSYTPEYHPEIDKKYVVQYWVKNKEMNQKNLGYIEIKLDCDTVFRFQNNPTNQLKLAEIEGWTLLQTTFQFPLNTRMIKFVFFPSVGGTYYDDIRIYPSNAIVKTFVYAPKDQKLSAELDENNYATFYDYDETGQLIRIRKETERGIVTIKEQRMYQKK